MREREREREREAWVFRAANRVFVCLFGSARSASAPVWWRRERKPAERNATAEREDEASV